MTFWQWLGWFVGTPPRFLTTLGVILFVYGLFHPHEIGVALNALFAEFFAAVEPFKVPALTLVVMIAGSVWALRKALAATKKGGRK